MVREKYSTIMLAGLLMITVGLAGPVRTVLADAGGTGATEATEPEGPSVQYLQIKKKLLATKTEKSYEKKQKMRSELAGLKDRASVEAFCELLRDQDTFLRIWSANILGKIHDPSTAEALSRVFLEDGNIQVQTEVFEALMQFKDPPAEPFVKALEHENAWFHDKAVVVLGRKKDPRSVPGLVKMLTTNPKDETREGAAQLLGIIGDPSARAALKVSGAEDPSAHVRDAAREALSLLKKSPARVPRIPSAGGQIEPGTVPDPALLAGQLQIEGILDGAVPVALINGEIVKAGDEIAGVKVARIANDLVEFEYAGGSFQLRMDERPEDQEDATDNGEKITLDLPPAPDGFPREYHDAERYFVEASRVAGSPAKAAALYQRSIEQAGLALKRAEDPAFRSYAGTIRDRMQFLIEDSRRKMQVVKKPQRSQDAVFQVPVLNIAYYPLKGDRIDSSKSRGKWGGWGETLTFTRARVKDLTQGVVRALEEGSRYHGYKDPGARPSLGYRVVKNMEFFEPIPSFPVGGKAKNRMDYNRIMEDIDVKKWVEREGVKEIWIWTYHDAETQSFESNMSSSRGDISNSSRSVKDLPVLDKSYTVYTYNYGRGVSEAVENHMHQIESVFTYADGVLFQRKFIGRNDEGRCGWSHVPPNGTGDYDWKNKDHVLTDIEDWTPEGTGQKTRMNCERWECDSLKWFIFWMQNVPGYRNNLTYQGRPLMNWWRWIGDFDGAVKEGRSL